MYNTDIVASRAVQIEPTSVSWLRNFLLPLHLNQSNVPICLKYVIENPPEKLLNLKHESLKLQHQMLLCGNKRIFDSQADRLQTRNVETKHYTFHVPTQGEVEKKIQVDSECNKRYLVKALEFV